MESTGGDQLLTIISLPFDILCKIVMEMDNEGIFALRRVCKKLNAVTKTRQLWYKFICDLTNDYKVSPPEEEIENYTTEELEQWVVLRRYIRRAWQGPELGFRLRIAAEDVNNIGEEISSYQLLPGGRWLVAPRMRCMYFYNLDAPTLEPRLLFDPKTEWNDAAKYCRYWIDRSKSRLTFYLAGRVSSSQADVARAFIYRVELVGHGAEAYLVAINLGTLRLEKPQWRYTPAAAINDRYYVEVWGGMAHIYYYQNTVEKDIYPDVLPTRFPVEGHLFWFIEFINDNVFALHVGEDLRLFEIVSPENPSSPRGIQLLHTIYPFTSQLRSHIHWAPDASQFVFLLQNRLRGVHIPHDTALPPTLVELGAFECNIDGEELNVLGILTSLSFYAAGMPVKVTTHLWNGWTGKATYVRKPVPVDIPGVIGSAVVIAYSEDAGRLLLWHSFGLRMELLILDLV